MNTPSPLCCKECKGTGKVTRGERDYRTQETHEWVERCTADFCAGGTLACSRCPEAPHAVALDAEGYPHCLTCSQRIVIHSGPDDLERYTFTLYWLADYHPGHPDGENRWAERGQVFHGKIDGRFTGVRVEGAAPRPASREAQADRGAQMAGGMRRAS